MMKTLRTIIFLCICLLAGLLGHAQNTRIQQLEQAVASSTGIWKAEKSIALADALMEQGDYAGAEKAAESAEEIAQQLQARDWLATALNRQGKALMAQGRKGFLGRDRSGPKFSKSNEILRKLGSTNKALMLDNLQNLRILADRRGRTEEVTQIDAEIVRLQTGGVPSAPSIPSGSPGVPVPSTPNPNNLSAGNSLQKNRAEEERWLKESQALQALLQQQENRISQMSETQMKTELMLLQKNQVLDSMMYRARLDSLEVSNWNLALREAESNRKFNYLIIAILLVLAAGATWSYFRARQNAAVLKAMNKVIREEQSRSENLLLNILPSLVADELKSKGRTQARYFEDVSVLFADFVGFSKIAEQLSPQQLVNELDTCFQAFDEIIAKYGLEKIKTIGDAYMCAGGLPDGGGSMLRSMVEAAREMQFWLNQWNDNREKSGQPRYDARIGIHCGPVVAGVVGSKKFAFDIWGDTVNIASRVEQAGEGGKINISGEAYQVVRAYFPCTYRGKIAVKNKGEIDMYFVEN
ncbi:MAG: adenylate/guanylate cyclase domain-containing protein [Bacteroidetes bacterium]|nr:adenylate/guanylate cyclase domain-containing protein [Bacteroidota bacterium]